MVKAVLGLAGKFNARMKSQSGDELIVSTSERSSQLNAPVSINFKGKNLLIISLDVKLSTSADRREESEILFQFKRLTSTEGSSSVF